jgi:hypothetical protein
MNTKAVARMEPCQVALPQIAKLPKASTAAAIIEVPNIGAQVVNSSV